MDAKITKKRFTAMLSYDWIKMVALALAMCFFWTLVFTISSTSITHSQEFVVFNHSNNAAFSSSFYDLMKSSHSYEVLEDNVRDLASTPDQAHTIYQSYFAAGMGDILFVANNPAPTPAEGEEAQEKESQKLLDAYFSYVQPADEFIEDLKTYLSSYFENGVLNQAKVKNDFLSMIRQRKDKRFKTQAQIDVGVTQEYARIQGYYDAVQAFDSYLESGLVRFEECTVTFEETVLTKHYLLNICPDSMKAPNMKDYVSWRTSDNKNTAQDMCVAFLKLNADTVYTGECLTLITKLVAAAQAA